MHSLKMNCPHADADRYSECSFNVEGIFCRRPEHLVCDVYMADLVRDRGPDVALVQRVEEVGALAARMERFDRAAVYVLAPDEGRDVVARGLVVGLDDGGMHLVDLRATRTLGPIGDVLPGLTLVGHGLKSQLVALAPWVSRETLDLFDTELVARLLDGGRRPGRKPHGLRHVLGRYLGVVTPDRLELPWGGFLSSLHQRQAGEQVAHLLRLADELDGQLQHHGLGDAAALEQGVLPAVVEMEIAGIGVDFSAWRNLVCHRRQAAEELHQRLCVQLGLPDLRHAEPIREALSAVLGVYLPGTKLVDIAPFLGTPLVQDLRLYRRYQAFLDQHGWPILEQLAELRDGRVRCAFDQLGAVTGRFTSSGPNLLGIPRDQAVRNCFKAASGHVLVDADYSCIDLRVLAQITKDEKLIHLFRSGGDVHRQTASRMVGIDPTLVSEKQRMGAKPVNFGVCYGMGAAGLVDSALEHYGIVLSHDEAARWIEAFLLEYPGVAMWQNNVRAAQPSEVRTLGARLRYFDGSEPRYTEQLATMVQGSTADGFKRAIAALYLPLKRLGARIVLAPHDQLLVEAPAENAKVVAQTVETKMVEAMADYLTDVPVEVKVKPPSTSWSA